MHLTTRSERFYLGLNYIALTLISLAFVLPLLFVVSASFVSEAEIVRRGSFVLIPDSPDFGAYSLIFRGRTIFSAYSNSLFRVTVGVMLNLFFTSTFAYALSKRDLPGRTALTLLVFIPLIFSGGIIPTFILIQAVGLRDSIWSMIIPSLINPFWLLIMRNFFMQIPVEFEEAAIIDGASPPQILWNIMLPLSMPIFATIGMFYAVWHWNAWFDASIYIDQINKLPIQVILRNLLIGTALMDPTTVTEAPPPLESLKAALTVVTVLPILVVYPFIQKHFIKGALIGGIKG